MMLKLPRFCWASGMFAQSCTDGFHIVMRQKVASLVRIRGSINSILKVVAEDPRAVLRHLMRNHCPHDMPPLPTDHVISKMAAGPRYQYMAAPDGLHLVDLWLKSSDVLASARYDPDVSNYYRLFTRANPTGQVIPFGAVDILKASNFDPSKKTVVLVHGWKNTRFSDFNVYLVDAYLKAEDVNLLMVDWSIGAAGSYLSAFSNVGRSGEHAAQYITWLNSASGARIQDYHIIGHSLGGHQVGVIGRLLGGRVPYITSLDPALPGFVGNPRAFQSTDGGYTEVMHTDAGLSGLISPVGDVDFYPNGGSNMPGCGDRSCSHHKCIFYMAESLIQGGFAGNRCNSLTFALTGNCSSSETLTMGGTVPKTGSTGMYFLNTNAESPFSQS